MAIVDLATLLSWYDTGQFATDTYVYVIVPYVYQGFRCACDSYTCQRKYT